MKKAAWLALLAGTALILALSGCGGQPDAEATVAALVSITGSPAETSSPGSAGLGRWAESSGLAMAAHTVEDPAAPNTQNYQPKPGTRLVAVEFELGCLSDAFHGATNEAQLIDDRGVRHDPVFGATADHPEFGVVELAMGEKARGWLAFELPEGAAPAMLEYKPNVWWDVIELQVSLVE